jgi:uncharacterized protein
LIFEEIPLQIYESFHKTFSGINEKTFETCRKCGGACEHNKIITLLPGEREYMAKQMNINVFEFEVRYLDILRMDDGTQLYVLKLGELCPFLNKETKECECRSFKPVFCKVYPVIFTFEAENMKYTLDNWCKLSQNKEFQVYFKTAIPLLSGLPIPLDWFRYVANYDYLCFDYNQLEKYKSKKKIYRFFSLKEVLGSEKNKSGTVDICINFG